MIANCKNGISSYELHRALGVTQKTAWFMLHRVRLAMQGDSPEKLSGKIEADETFIGGSARFMHKSRKEKTLKGGRGTSGKAIVMGILERGDKKEKGKKTRENQQGASRGHQQHRPGNLTNTGPESGRNWQRCLYR